MAQSSVLEILSGFDQMDLTRYFSLLVDWKCLM